MLTKLASLEERYEALTRQLSDPAVLAQQSEFQKLARSHAGLTQVVDTYRVYRKTLLQLEEAETLLQDKLEAELRELAEMEAAELEEKKETLEQELKILLLPQDPNDAKNVIMEIRAGTGGEEAALFAGALFRMYIRYAEKQGWRSEILSENPTDIGGYKEIVFLIEGQGAYSRLKFESGVHRVQRVPSTEASGRIHTSAATVAVLPEAEEVEVEINPGDIRVDLFCSSGPGGQSVNTTQSAVRITHLESGIVVSCQDEKSQHKNKDKALRVLRARLLDLAQEEQHGELASTRRHQVGSGDRSERIRTYNYPQGRVSDHRLNLTLYKLEPVLDGELNEFIEALITNAQAEQLKQTD